MGNKQSISTSKKYEIWVIVILVLTIILAHSAPVIANEFYIPWSEQLNNEIIENIELVDILSKNKSGCKYYNIFKDDFILDIKSFNFKNKNIKNSRFGKNYEIMDTEQNENTHDFKSYITKYLDIKNDHLVYLVKANTGHRIEKGVIEMIHNFNGTLKEAKSIWYFFTNLKWEFKNKWIFRNIDNDTYNVPENNSIIEFSKDDTFEMSELVSEEPKYFIAIINF